jgi:uncharacterized membrane-anchored protein
VIAAQAAILAAIPVRTIRALATGVDVTLETRPVDPYDALSGYYVALAYAAETGDMENEDSAAADRTRRDAGGGEAWVTVERCEPAWKPVSATRERPAPVEGRVTIRARWRWSRARIESASRLYLPETQRERAEARLREAKGIGLVDLRVDEGGYAVPMRLRVGGETFGEP